METHFLPLHLHSCIFYICQCSRGHGSLLYVADRNYLFYLSCVLFCYQYDQVMSSSSLWSLWCCLRTLTVTDTFNMQLSKQSRLPKDWICKVNWNESVVVAVSTCCCCLWQHLAVPLIASPPSITPRHVSRVTINISSQLPPAPPILDSHTTHITSWLDTQKMNGTAVWW